MRTVTFGFLIITFSLSFLRSFFSSFGSLPFIGGLFRGEQLALFKV